MNVLNPHFKYLHILPFKTIQLTQLHVVLTFKLEGNIDRNNNA